MKLKKGFTFVELLIVIVVIAVLATMMMLASDEAVVSAKASKIISNLENIKSATVAWYMDNRDKVAKVTDKNIKRTGNANGNANQEQFAGKIIINSKIGSPQHYTGAQLGLYKYFHDPGAQVLVNQIDSTGYGSNTVPSNLLPGCYGFYDEGTSKNGTIHYHTIWYVGYCFDNNEERVKKKVLARMGTLDLYPTTTADPYDIHNHSEAYDDNKKLKNLNSAKAVWLKVLEIN